MGIKQILKKIIYREKSSSEDYISYLRKIGVTIGDNCTFYEPRKTHLDLQNPYMLEIGDFVRITSGVQILTHDYSFSVLASVGGDIIGSVEKTTIGNNVFLGRNAIVLKGVSIGDNVIIGAGSVVTKNCKSNSVYAGVPAKFICTIEELYQKRKNKEKENIKKLALSYYKQYGKRPDSEILREYQMFFANRSENLPESLNKLMKDSGNYDLCLKYFNESKTEFEDINDLLDWCELPR